MVWRTTTSHSCEITFIVINIMQVAINDINAKPSYFSKARLARKMEYKAKINITDDLSSLRFILIPQSYF